MSGARGEGAEAQAPGDGHRRGTGRSRAVAELAVEVGAPAIGRPGAREPAVVSAAGGQGGEGQAPSDGDRREPRRYHRPVAELPRSIIAPAVSRPGAREPAGVTDAGGEWAEAQTPG